MFPAGQFNPIRRGGRDKLCEKFFLMGISYFIIFGVFWVEKSQIPDRQFLAWSK
jgi:hypothetical protein